MMMSSGVSAPADENRTAIRKAYMARLVLRCIIFTCCILLFLSRPGAFSVLGEGQFFHAFSPLHLLWAVWVAESIEQLLPISKKAPLGSQKLFRRRFRPVREEIDRQALRRYIVSTTRGACWVVLIWAVMLAVIGRLYRRDFIGGAELFLISAAFYVCDLICVLIWCPFRLMVKARCCTTCRIFNWDHLMMFSPMMFLKGFYARSLLVLSIAVWLVWELCVFLHPERFWEDSNEALRCSMCTDKLCTQYCRKLRR